MFVLTRAVVSVSGVCFWFLSVLFLSFSSVLVISCGGSLKCPVRPGWISGLPHGDPYWKNKTKTIRWIEVERENEEEENVRNQKHV